MFKSTSVSAVRGRATLVVLPIRQRRCYASSTQTASKDEGDISSVFRSLSGSDESEKLPQRFANVKRGLVRDKAALHSSWNRLLSRLHDETQQVKAQGSACIPQISFSELDKSPEEFNNALRKRGVAVIRQVIPEDEAREFKAETERYVAANPSTKGKCCFLIHLMERL